MTQAEGLNLPPLPKGIEAFHPIEAAQAIVMGWKECPTIMSGGNRAAYSPFKDEIHMPAKESFESEEAYYQTLFHEMGHATGHASRLARFKENEANTFGSASYSLEELVAEMVCAFLCQEAGIPNMEPQAAYIQGWLESLGRDKRMVVQAAGKAQKAANLILGRTANQEETEAETAA